MLHACYLLTGAQAEGRREGPRPVGIEAVQLHRRVGAIACAHAARDRPRGRTPVRVPGATAAVTSERGRATPFFGHPPPSTPALGPLSASGGAFHKTL